MRPNEWSNWTTEQKAEWARELLDTARGQHLLLTGLVWAAEHARESGALSDADELEALAEGLFPLGREAMKLWAPCSP